MSAELAEIKTLCENIGKTHKTLSDVVNAGQEETKKLGKESAETKAAYEKVNAELTKLCDSIGASMIYDHDLLTIRATVDDTVTSSEVSVSLGLIVTELVINALKHAFPDRGTAGTITVEYWSRPSGWRLAVEDNGVGMPCDGATAKPGLGTGIVDALSKQLDATVTVSDTKPGTRVAIIHIAK